MANLFQSVPEGLAEELIESLGRSEHVRIERIVSRGQVTPEGCWYDQEDHEFVLLVSGRARLAYADATPAVALAPGDWLIIPAHVRHRVDWTDPDQDTIWLAVHYR
jgi:cupin 2 domain-containing protein